MPHPTPSRTPSATVPVLWAGTVACLLVAAIVSAAPEAPPAVGPWPQWRGPRRDNVSDDAGLLKQWPKDGPPLAWKAKGVGAGYSSPSVAGGRVYTMGDAADACYVIAVDESTGKELWRAKVGPTGGGGGFPGPRCTPTVDPADGKHLYALGQHGDLVCLETDAGKEVWRKHMVKDFEGLMVAIDLSGRSVPPWGYSEGPLVDGDRLVCTPGGPKGTLIALNKKTGDVLWRTAKWTDPAVYSSPLAADIAGRRQYVQLTGTHLAGVDAETGQVLWTTTRFGGPAVVPTPIVHEDTVFATSGYGIGCHLYRVTTHDLPPTADGGAGAAAGAKPAKEFRVEVVYANRSLKNHLGGVVRVGDYVYGSNDPGILTCLKWSTGDLMWKDRSVGKGSVTAADGMIYLRGQDGAGTVALVEATSEAYRERGRFDPPDRSGQSTWPPPVVAGGRMYLRDQDVLLCYDVRAK